MQEDIPDTPGGDLIEGQGSGEEIAIGIKIAHWESSFRLMRSCLENQGNCRAH